VLTAAALIAIPWLLYLRVIIEQPRRLIGHIGGVQLVRLGSQVYRPGEIQNGLGIALVVAALLAFGGLRAVSLRQKLAPLLSVIEIAAWALGLGVTALYVFLMIALARSGFNH
jgi:hypothetical protein